ncbi:MAG: hypothetical protein IKJ65_07325 [Clostridia bacterium]|nr:hypothetical protein [Clostridia bacterium]
MTEINYAFRERMLKAHTRFFRDNDQWERVAGTLVTNAWEIVYPECAQEVLEYAAKDLQEFLSVSMDVFVRARRVEDIEPECANPTNKILLYVGEVEEKEDLAYRIVTDDDAIRIIGKTPRAAAQGVYFIEDRMRVHQGPVVEYLDVTRKPLFPTRMIHSGFGLDMFPDEHLRAIARNGITSILVFTKGVDKTPHGYLDFNNLIYRANRFGLDVYAYSYMKSEVHPSDKHAAEYYEGTYGNLFKSCPGLKGVVLVGESVEFPSKDEHVCPYGWEYLRDHPEANPNHLPSPGWYPCYDYPEWIDLVKGIIRKHKKDADFVFWSYNWGYVNREARLKLIRSLPTDISLLVTFEMFEKFEKPGNVTVSCVDYTLSFEGPGEYFRSEAEEAKKRGIPLYAMSNTGGLSWDIGVIPYEPCPDQWNRRNDNLIKAHEDWGLCGLMDSHHYGFWPSIISELAKIAYWSPRMDYETALRELINRDYGEKNVETVREVFRNYSDAIRSYVSTNPDQYGPFRIGPAYPLLYKEEAILESPDYAMHSHNMICDTMYKYDLNKLHYLAYEMESLSKMEALLKQGSDALLGVIDSLTGRQKQCALDLYGVGRFMQHTARTAVNTKKWYLLKLEFMKDGRDKKDIAEKMTEIAKNEIENAKATIPLVERDSRLGFEPSMEYMCDRAHLEWKIFHTEKAMGAIHLEANA